MKKRIAQILSALALAGTMVPPCLFFADAMTLAAVLPWMLGATVLWFIATPLWMEHKATD
jgi:hypothetical protein